MPWGAGCVIPVWLYVYAVWFREVTKLQLSELFTLENGVEMKWEVILPKQREGR